MTTKATRILHRRTKVSTHRLLQVLMATIQFTDTSPRTPLKDSSKKSIHDDESVTSSRKDEVGLSLCLIVILHNRTQLSSPVMKRQPPTSVTLQLRSKKIFVFIFTYSYPIIRNRGETRRCVLHFIESLGVFSPVDFSAETSTC